MKEAQFGHDHPVADTALHLAGNAAGIFGAGKFSDGLPVSGAAIRGGGEFLSRIPAITRDVRLRSAQAAADRTCLCP